MLGASSMLKKNLEGVQHGKEKWEQDTVPKSLEKLPEKGDFFTSSDIPVGRIYTPIDITGSGYLQDLGFPGEFPLTRGVFPTMYRARFWTMRQYAGFGGSKEIPSSSSVSPDRFVCVAGRVKEYRPVVGCSAAEYAFETLASVRVGNDTKWTIVFDLKRMEIQYKTLR